MDIDGLAFGVVVVVVALGTIGLVDLYLNR